MKVANTRSAQTYCPNRTEFDTTELPYYSSHMTTPQNHTPRSQPQCAKHSRTPSRHSCTHVIPAKAGIRAPDRHPSVPHSRRHSCTRLPSFPHPPTSFPRRRESARPREATAFRFLSQSPPAARADAKLAVDGNRHNATEFYEPQRKLVPARTRARRSQHGGRRWVVQRPRERCVPSRHSRTLSTSFPHPPSSFPRRRESARPCDATAFRSLPNRRVQQEPAATHRRRKSTQCDRIQQSTTKTRARARGVPLLRVSSPMRPSRTHPRHSRTPSRHSREGGNLHARARQRRSASFPNRRTQQEPMPNPPSTEIDTIRQRSTNHNGNSCPRARRPPVARLQPNASVSHSTPVLPALNHVIPALNHVIPALNHVIPAPTLVIPAKAGIPPSAIDQRTGPMKRAV